MFQVIEYNVKKDAYTDWPKKQVLQKLQESSYHPITSVAYCGDELILSDESCLYIFDRTEQLVSMIDIIA